jgi:hypothetical protein
VSILDSSSERGLSEPINNYGDESEEGGDKDYVNDQSGEDGENSVDEAVAAFLKERAAKKKKEKKPVKERVSLSMLELIVTHKNDRAHSEGSSTAHAKLLLLVPTTHPTKMEKRNARWQGRRLRLCESKQKGKVNKDSHMYI